MMLFFVLYFAAFDRLPADPDLRIFGEEIFQNPFPGTIPKFPVMNSAPLLKGEGVWQCLQVPV